jgi:DNA-binding NarL/FixJ family response regulator
MRIAYECGATSPAIVGARVVLPLTRREREVAILVTRGLPNRTIADVMSLSVRTVEGHVYRASVKAGVTTRTELSRVIGQFDSLEQAAC